MQTGGRGRQGRVWRSPPGNLYASTLVRPLPGDPPAPTLAFVAAVAVEEAVASWLGPDKAVIKWPNDLLVGRAKLAGILLEARDGAVVVGCGVNLVHHPIDIERPATDIRAEGGQAPAPDAALAALAHGFAQWLSVWRADGLAPIIGRWMDRAHPLGTPLVARLVNGGEVEGRFAGLDQNGSLILRRAEGGSERIHAGDVFLL